MQTMKKVVCMVLAMVLGLSLSGIVVSAATNDNSVLGTSGFEVRNVKFIQDGKEVFTIPESGRVSADVVISHPTGGTVTLILAAYDANNNLKTATITTAQEVIPGLPTVSTNAIDVAGAASVKAMVWDNTDKLSPISATAIADSYVLSDESRDNRITSYALEIKDGDTIRTYNGLINHDLKTVHFYVPSIGLGDWDSSGTATQNYYGTARGLLGVGSKTNYLGKTTGSNGAIGDINYKYTPTDLMNVTYTNYQSAIVSRTEGLTEVSSITYGTGASLVTEVTNPDFHNGQKYTVQAVNGETATYTVTAEPMAVPYISDFDDVTQATVMTKKEIDALKETGKFTDWTTYSKASVLQYRSGMISDKGKSGGAWWNFASTGDNSKDNPPVTYKYYNNDKTKAYAFDDDSAIKLTLPYRTDSPTDKYAEFVFGRKTAGVNYHIRCNNSGMKARESVFVSFDYKLDPVDTESPIAGNIRVQLEHKSGTYSNAVMMSSGQVKARATTSDDDYIGASADKTGYTTITTKDYAPAKDGEWHNLQMIQRIVDGYASGTNKKAMLFEVYLDGEYAGYTYSTDYDDVAICASKLAFTTGYNTQMKFSMDDFVWGTPFAISETTE